MTIETLSDKMTELAQYALPGKNYNAEKAEEYYNVQRQYQEAKASQKKPVKQYEAVMCKTFVNSFGEATKREITNTSYEKQQRRLSKEIFNYIS
jgi:ribosomal protein S18